MWAITCRSPVHFLLSVLQAPLAENLAMAPISSDPQGSEPGSTGPKLGSPLSRAWPPPFPSKFSAASSVSLPTLIMATLFTQLHFC